MATLAEIVGPENVHATDILRVSPASTEELSAILRFAHENHLAVIPTGGGTKLSWGNPVEAAIHLSLARMNALREHAWQDMTCTVQAGCTWSALQSQLAQHGQQVPLDPLWPARATVGGIVATNDSGALRLKYGGLRDLILGMTVVLADGTIAKTGGKVVKNVAGYDVHKLMCGAFGTLGIIAEVNFRLHPIESPAQTWTLTAPDPMLLDPPMRALLDSQLAPTSIQLRTAPEGFALDVRLTQSVPHSSLSHRDEWDPASETVWQLRQSLFDSPSTLLLKASMLPAEIPVIASLLQTWSTLAGAGLAFAAQATGLATIAVTCPPEAALPILARLRAALEPTGGTVFTIRGADPDPWGPPPDTLPLMRELKRRFDPHRILNPGRFLGGI
jgi:glycolate oxidase FAD binding subunit